MLKRIFSSLLFLFFILSCNSQKSVVTDENASAISENTTVSNHTNTKLVVGIVVDQMRYDYLTRFYNKYGDGGFKRMIKEGFNCRNNHFNYVPTYTGPGHASVYTGTTPKYHGIIGNNWYDKEQKTMVYCAQDDTVSSVGTTDDAGQMSPNRMKTTSFTDENRLFTQMQGKTIGISLKDRGAILPAGHTANAAYWFHGRDEGVWISSTFYMNSLPQWVSDFNASEKAASYFKVWDTYYDISSYTESGPDENTFEGGFRGKEKATFPYDLAQLKDENRGFDILKATPYGNSLTTDFAIEAIKGEQLGQDNITDVLAVSYSATDYVGHNFGVSSKEIEDTYIRLDKDLERFFEFLDTEVGEGQYTVFLTADHGAVEVPAFLQSMKIPSGYLDNSETRTRFTDYLNRKFKSSDFIENISNDQIFLNRRYIDSLGLHINQVQESIVNELISYKHVEKVFSAHTMTTTNFTTGIESLLQNGYNQKRSGDIILVADPAYISYGKTGSTHGSGLNYDTHVPLLFFGKGITHGETYQKTVIPDIAPTISALLGISFPNAATGQPLGFVIDKN
ncbi:alkaline phosphatase PafA [Psychroserpens algicola]|uniref:Alkaline phosphatase family protein n=1 Tax=Psychroserpens algicola TaxID=1719034 RepID=A0ABT0H6V5_9FLAO|nr:alkaline phosphatase PafA [Psychroserpens algicola]MCK8480090.1 alkaline phosphatase family protein [Psychroserpens algicola]